MENRRGLTHGRTKDIHVYVNLHANISMDPSLRYISAGRNEEKSRKQPAISPASDHTRPQRAGETVQSVEKKSHTAQGFIPVGTG